MFPNEISQSGLPGYSLTHPLKKPSIAAGPPESRRFMALVLCTGVDKAVLETRKLILQAAGHTVVTTMDEISLLDACKKHSFDIAVVGHVISRKMKRRVAMLIKQHCSDVKLLELYPPYTGAILDDADSWLMVPADIPEELTDRVNELANKEAKAG
jgi:CheY-like chemotaxis protein